MNEGQFPYPHDMEIDIFREALAYSEANTGFTETLIEKDYFCSLVLQYFFDNDASLVFKGGTCLSKVYTDFYRLSEDLDFVIPVAAETSRGHRRNKIEPVKLMFEKLPEVVPGITISQGLTGHNESRQYIGHFEYPSSLMDKKENIKIEIGLREPLLNPMESRTAHTIAVNPFSDRPLLPSFFVHAMAMKEAFSEKFRAAMTRKEPAIRDFFDLLYAVREMGLTVQEHDFVSMVRKKIAIPDNFPIDISPERKRELDRQLKGQLEPVLRPFDFNGFNLDEAFKLVCTMAKAVFEFDL
jgi:predicted nucleotidyltransferase component of viral defense system